MVQLSRTVCAIVLCLRLYKGFSLVRITNCLLSLKETILMKNIFILCAQVIIEHIFVGFIKNIIFIKRSNTN